MRILIAEQTKTSRLILQEILTPLGHDVVTAANGQEASTRSSIASTCRWSSTTR